MSRLRKALLASAFFVVFTNPPATASDCSPPDHPSEQVELGKVIDGDTLRLNDGRPIRLIGINTPELGHGKQADEPLAEQARRTLKRLIDHQPLHLYPGQDARDRHGRTLAHLFNSQGESIEAAMLREGLAFRVAVTPNLSLQACFAKAESTARQQRRGVWSEPYYSVRHAAALTPSDAGFARIAGRVTKAGRNRSGLYLELDNALYLPVQRSADALFEQAELERLAGRDIEVRGWLTYRRLNDKQRQRGYLPFVLSLSHPSMIENN